MRILWIDACVRNSSRTRLLADKILSDMSGEVDRLVLQEADLLPLDGARLALRDALLAKREFTHPMFDLARHFAEADHIVIAAPYWDLAFPALLKIYLEAVTVAGITFSYQDGVPVGLCRAKKLTYVTTAGGQFVKEFGYGYLASLAKGLYGIRNTECYYAENLDVFGITQDNFWRQALIHHLTDDQTGGTP